MSELAASVAQLIGQAPLLVLVAFCPAVLGGAYLASRAKNAGEAFERGLVGFGATFAVLAFLCAAGLHIIGSRSAPDADQSAQLFVVLVALHSIVFWLVAASVTVICWRANRLMGVCLGITLISVEFALLLWQGAPQLYRPHWMLIHLSGYLLLVASIRVAINPR